MDTNFRLPMNSYQAIDLLVNQHDFFLTFLSKKIIELRGNLNNIIASVEVNSESVVVEIGENSNVTISLRKDNRSDYVMSYPGKTLVFLINKEFQVVIYKYDAVLEKYVVRDAVVVKKNKPILIDGECEAYHVISVEDTLIGNVNFPLPSGEVNVFNKVSGKVKFWFLSDNGAARFLFVLQALNSIGDENLTRVAKETIYHYHPAVQWESFKIIKSLPNQSVDKYKEILLSFKNKKIIELLSSLRYE
ncbi:hypothetical protein [Serratia sp. OS31]|uniref:hypothetical protein n=1 Tax=Serratia sp. OS31 TaxID=2760844 RepID=UPI001603A2DB|nr:hypothetical protein [Serratia sp. OS31]MBB1585098.1 hypothetical protein [Serratia sp. OS31]